MTGSRKTRACWRPALASSPPTTSQTCGRVWMIHVSGWGLVTDPRPRISCRRRWSRQCQSPRSMYRTSACKGPVRPRTSRKDALGAPIHVFTMQDARGQGPRNHRRSLAGAGDRQWPGARRRSRPCSTCLLGVVLAGCEDPRIGRVAQTIMNIKITGKQSRASGEARRKITASLSRR